MADPKVGSEIKLGSPSQSDPSPIMIDLGRQNRKKVKRLLKGEGALFGEVECAVQEMRETGKINQAVQLVFVNVEKKRKKRDLTRTGLGLFG